MGRFGAASVCGSERQPASLGLTPGRNDPAFVQLILEELMVTGKGVASQIAVTASDTWSAGDAQRLDHELLDEVRQPRFAGIYKTMFTDRNRQMTDRLLQLAATPKKHFVVVGAGHVVGRDGILELLKAEGFEVRQLPRR